MLVYRKKSGGVSGISTLEYALLLAAIAAALVAMQFALRRTIASRWKQSSDLIGDGRQYEEGATTITYH